MKSLNWSRLLLCWRSHKWTCISDLIAGRRGHRPCRSWVLKVKLLPNLRYRRHLVVASIWNLVESLCLHHMALMKTYSIKTSRLFNLDRQGHRYYRASIFNLKLQQTRPEWAIWDMMFHHLWFRLLPQTWRLLRNFWIRQSLTKVEAPRLKDHLQFPRPPGSSLRSHP